MVGGFGDDEIKTNTAQNNIHGGGGNDTIYDAVNGLFFNTNGSDTFDGDEGIDTVSYELTSNRSYLINLFSNEQGSAIANFKILSIPFSETDQLYNIENVTTAGLNDQVFGNDLDNVIKTLGGDDIIAGGLGKDVIDGGEGQDTASYALSSSYRFEIVLDEGSTDGIAAAYGIGELDSNLQYIGQTDTLINIENVVGSQFDDKITGNSESNTIDAGAGNDIISVGIGNAEGNIDYIDGGSGNNTLDLTGAMYSYTVDLAITMFGNDGTWSRLDWWDANGDDIGDSFVKNIDNINGSNVAGYQNFWGNDNANIIHGGNNSGFSTLDGRGGDDTIYGGLGVDNVIGGEGNDTISFYDMDSYRFIINFTNGTALALGVTSSTQFPAQKDTFNTIENAVGTQFSDSLYGDSNLNKLYGMEGADLFKTGGGGDFVDGGAGADTVTYEDSTSTRYILYIGDPEINGDSHNRIDAYTLAADFIESETLDNIETFYTGNAGDIVFGGAGSDTIYTLDGDDRIEGRYGSDFIDGGAGSDTVVFTSDKYRYEIVLEEGIGSAISYNTNGDSVDINTLINVENVIGSGFGDKITLNSANNTIDAGAGDDTIILIGTGLGQDYIDGGTGNNTIDLRATNYSWTVDLQNADPEGWYTLSYFDLNGGFVVGTTLVKNIYNVIGSDQLGSTAYDWIFGNENANILNAGNGSGGIEEVYGYGGDDKLYGEASPDLLDGGSGNDTLYGGLGTDTLKGGADNDILYGGLGNDTIDGGADNDTISFYDMPTYVFTVDMVAGTAQKSIFNSYWYDSSRN